MKKRMYLDYAASTPIDKNVLAVMMPYLKENYGNPSSTHAFGQKARAGIEKARVQVAQFLHCQADEVIFTSGATEANNLAIRGVIQNTKYKIHDTRPHIITSAIEHESVLEVCEHLEKEGIAEITYVQPQHDGIIKAEDIRKAIKSNTVLVSIMYANSEIGTVQPIAQIAKMLAAYKIQNTKYKLLFHVDAVQAANYLDCDVEKLSVDLFVLSGHKIYGPKGVGVLYHRKEVSLSGIMRGGGQEMGLRSGTENVAAICGMGEAVSSLTTPQVKVSNVKIRQMRDELIKGVLAKIPESSLSGSMEKRLENNAHFRFKGIEGRNIAVLLDQKGIAISTGSACSEKTQEPSHVLLALGLEPREALSSIRITLGKHTKKEDIKHVLKVLPEVILQLRKNKI
jgi:cysteine desulfurase